MLGNNLNTVYDKYQEYQLWYVSPIYGIYLGFVFGFFVTLAKSPPFILSDCLYGSFLGLILSMSYNLFVLSFNVYMAPLIDVNIQSNRSINDPLKDEIELDRARLNKKKYIFANPEDGPISSRTRSNKHSLLEDSVIEYKSSKRNRSNLQTLLENNLLEQFAIESYVGKKNSRNIE
jgi:hypothetical protein